MSNVTISNNPLGRHLVFTAKAVREAFEESLSEAGASLGIWVVLTCLSDEGLISQSELAGHVHLEGATITHHIDRLEQLGLVRRKPDPGDRRVRRLELTPEGERLHRLLVVAMRGFEQRVFAGVSEKQKAELRKTLDRISANLA
ncbi:MAG TPA: MarR family transcriptional regulator [Gaiellaceae bacterium]|jgi:MarR family transcriptional regulator for hemolysin|nr:MarR family transcriptional regulator [Gaiellaceae bacterium]